VTDYIVVQGETPTVAVGIFCDPSPNTQISRETLVNASAAALDDMDSCQVVSYFDARQANMLNVRFSRKRTLGHMKSVAPEGLLSARSGRSRFREIPSRQQYQRPNQKCLSSPSLGN